MEQENRTSQCSLQSWGGLFKQETKKEASSRECEATFSVVSSVNGSLFAVFLRELLRVLHEFCTILAVFLRQVGPQRMLWLRVVHQTNETLKNLRRKGTQIYVIYVQSFHI